MKLRGVEFGYCLGQSGVQGFFGEGYPYHRYLKPFGLRFKGMTFVAKTTTLHPRLDPSKKLGNMPLRDDGITPAEFKPKCIVVNLREGYALNAVGLSGPGARQLFQAGVWQRISEPFMISFMSVESDADARLRELSEFVGVFKSYLPSFQAPVALQINFSCPNVKVDHDADHVADEVREALKIAAELGIPLMPKINVVLPVSVAATIAENPNCDGLCVSNTIPWGQLPDKIDWKRMFDSGGVSPLAHLGGGGLSGGPLLPIVLEWVRIARIDYQIRIPINVGGGIMSPTTVNLAVMNGASSVAIGSMTMLRPWRVQSTINRANQLGRMGTLEW